MKTEFLQPTSIQEASTILSEDAEARIIAGGTAVVLALANKLATPSALVSLGRIPDLDFIRREEDGIHLGALASIRAAEQSGVVQDFCAGLRLAYGAVGNVRVRNQATVGGNLAEADYASDPPTMLLALNARVRAQTAKGIREIPIKEFFIAMLTTALAPNEILTEIIVPALPASAQAAYLRFTSRSSEARPSANVAVVLDADREGRCRDLRIAVGAAVMTPQRLPETEASARGEVISNSLADQIAHEYAARLDPIDDKLESAWYRRELIRVLVRRALDEVRNGNR